MGTLNIPCIEVVVSKYTAPHGGAEDNTILNIQFGDNLGNQFMSIPMATSGTVGSIFLSRTPAFKCIIKSFRFCMLDHCIYPLSFFMSFSASATTSSVEGTFPPIQLYFCTGTWEAIASSTSAAICPLLNSTTAICFTC